MLKNLIALCVLSVAACSGGSVASPSERVEPSRSGALSTAPAVVVTPSPSSRPSPSPTPSPIVEVETVPPIPTAATVVIAVGDQPPGGRAHVQYTLNWCPVTGWLQGEAGAVFGSLPDEAIPGLDGESTWHAGAEIMKFKNGTPAIWNFYLTSPATAETMDKLDARWESGEGDKMRATISGMEAEFATEFSTPRAGFLGYQGETGKNVPGTVTVTCH